MMIQMLFDFENLNIIIFVVYEYVLYVELQFATRVIFEPLLAKYLSYDKFLLIFTRSQTGPARSLVAKIYLKHVACGC